MQFTSLYNFNEQLINKMSLWSDYQTNNFLYTNYHNYRDENVSYTDTIPMTHAVIQIILDVVMGF